MVSKHEINGLQTFVSKFSLPALIFVSLVDLNFDKVNWRFLLAILVSKSIVFFAVLVITMLTNSADNFLGRAGLFAIFCTQSNDFALGYPIISHIYSQTHPDYLSYIYLMAPISLLILNPVGFVLLEIETRKNSQSTQTPVIAIAGSIIKGIICNPILMMTFLGIVANIGLHGSLPSIVLDVLHAFSSAFTATALFLLGLYMVGALSALQETSKSVPVLLILIKLIALPLIIQEMINLMHSSKDTPSEISDLSTFGFLYGTFPTAPSVFVFATHYATEINLVANSMVFCTFLSAPLMFVSGKMITLKKLTPSDFVKSLDSYDFNISLCGIFASLWILVYYCRNGKWFKVPHRLVFNISIAQLFLSTSVVLLTINEHNPLMNYYLFSMGSFATKLWIMFLAISLLFLQCRSLCFILKLQKIFLLIGFSVPILVASAILIGDYNYIISDSGSRSPNLKFGKYFVVCSIVLLIVSFIVTIGCLILQQKYLRRLRESLVYQQNQQTSCDVVQNRATSPPVVDIEELGFSRGRQGTLGNLTTPEARDVVSSEPNLMCGPRFGCDSSTRRLCLSLVQNYDDINQSLISDDQNDELAHLITNAQIDQHVLYLIVMLCSIFVNFAYLLWCLLSEEKTGIFIEVEFLDSTLTFGQSLITFLFFGLNYDILCGKKDCDLQEVDNVNSRARFVCDQFSSRYLESFSAFIRKETRSEGVSFVGSCLIDWLLVQNLIRNRAEGIIYGKYLMEGRIIEHENRCETTFAPNYMYFIVCCA